MTKLQKLQVVLAMVILMLIAYKYGGSLASCNTCPTPEQVAYFADQSKAAMKLREVDRELTALLDEAKQSPGALYDERWRLRDILDRMNFAAADMTDPESPSGTEGHQQVTARYSEGQVEANELLWQAVLAEDAEQIYQANARRRESDRLLGKSLR